MDGFCNSNYNFEASQGRSNCPVVSLGEQNGVSEGQDSGFSDTINAQLSNIIRTKMYFLCKQFRLGLLRPLLFCFPPPNSTLYPL